MPVHLLRKDAPPPPTSKWEALQQALSAPGMELAPGPMPVAGLGMAAIDDLARLVGQLGGKANTAVPTARTGAKAGEAIGKALNNASGESAASLEHLSRMQSMKAAGKSLVRKLPDGREQPFLGGVDDSVNPGEQLGWKGLSGIFERLK